MPRSTKDWIKMIRGFLEGILLLFLAFIIIRALYIHKDYMSYENLTNQEETQREKGFIALSYFGVAYGNESGHSLISRSRLKEHLKAITDSGYVTITQQDIINYYKNGKALPDKALFLMFADGRNDTVIFAGQILKEYNLKATILTYAQNVIGKDNKFLHKKDLKTLTKNGFWEFGTGGYRLTYINVFDKWGNFLDVLTSPEFNNKADIIEADYNHYLMDYIRDKNRIPIENMSQLTSRINYDYNEMVNIYKHTMNKVPLLYSLMHANTGQFGTNDKASLINENNIKEIFQMNFNRDGSSVNTNKTDLYDLTRLSPKSDWYTNHLLMRIWQDTGNKLAFQYGEKENLNNWDIISGQPEFQRDTIILTSPPEKPGILFLKNKELKNQELSVELQGNLAGEQTVLFRAKRDLSSYISVSLLNNVLLVTEKKSGKENILFSQDLSIELSESNDGSTYNDSDDNKIDKLTLLESKKGNSLLKISLKEDKLTLELNGAIVAKNLNITLIEKGTIGIKSMASAEAFDYGIVEDTIYDGVFKNLVVTSFDSGEKNTIMDMNLKGLDKFVNSLKKAGAKILQWFIETL